jgi:hypothetical protein
VLSSQAPLVFRRPAFAPAGDPVRLTVEGYAPSDSNPTRHQVVSKVGELYLFEAP